LLLPSKFGDELLLVLQLHLHRSFNLIVKVSRLMAGPAEGNALFFSSSTVFFSNSTPSALALQNTHVHKACDACNKHALLVLPTFHHKSQLHCVRFGLQLSTGLFPPACPAKGCRLLKREDVVTLCQAYIRSKSINECL
jgi:hypothetical protein